MAATLRRAGIWLSAGSLLLLAGCGGGNTSGGTPAPVHSALQVSGEVTDGPVAGATVSLVDPAAGGVLTLCGASGQERCQTQTDAQGGFSFTLAAATLPAGSRVTAQGGEDTATGSDFSALTQQTPLTLFAGHLDAVTVSPLTSLLAARIASGESPAQAETDLCTWLGLAPGTPLAGSPDAERILLQRTLLLTRLAQAVQAAAPQQDPFASLAAAAGGSPLLAADGTFEPAPLAALPLDAATRQQLSDLAAALAQAPSGQDLTAVFKHVILRQVLDATLARLFADAGTFDPTLPAYTRNADLLVDQVLTAAGSSAIPLGGVVPQRIARYVLFNYGLTTSFSQFTVDAATFAASLQRQENGSTVLLSADPRIAELAAIPSRYAVSVPLLDDQLPGDNQALRRAYYFNSNISPFYLAEQVAGHIFDDVRSDAVMLDIAKGLADNGMLSQAKTVIETQIFRSQSKGDAWRAYAEALSAFGRSADASAPLGEALILYRRIVAAEGAANITSQDAENYADLAAAYRKAGDLTDAAAVLQELDGYRAYLTTAVAYGRLVVGLRDVAAQYLAAGQTDQAAPLVDTLYAEALATPANSVNGESYYQLKVYFLVQAAKLYAELGNANRVQQIAGTVAQIRADDGLTGLTLNATWPEMPDLVAALYQVGAQTQAQALASSIPDSYVDQAGRTVSGIFYRNQAFKSVATYLALNQGYAQALAYIDQNFTQASDKIEALTYFANNQQEPYIALSFINRGDFAAADQALAQATTLVGTLQESSDAMRFTEEVQRGYVKIAGLYHSTGDDTEAAALLAKAQSVADGLTLPEYRVDALAAIAGGWFEQGATTQAQAALLAAGGVLASDSSDSATERAGLYGQLIDTALGGGDKTLARALLPASVNVARSIFVSSSADHDSLAAQGVTALVRAADQYRQAGDLPDATQVLDSAAQVGSAIYVAQTRYQKLNAVVTGYAGARAFRKAMALAASFPYLDERNQAYQSIAETYAARDDFPGTDVASIDTDGDGKPDFFNPLATQAQIKASGLQLDQDCDGDGIPDSVDRTPFYYSPAGAN